VDGVVDDVVDEDVVIVVGEAVEGDETPADPAVVSSSTEVSLS